MLHAANVVHQQLFAQKVRDLDVIHVLPAQATLLQHTKRAAYKQAIAGDKHASLIHSFPVHDAGDGQLVQTVGNHYGQHF